MLWPRFEVRFSIYTEVLHLNSQGEKYTPSLVIASYRQRLKNLTKILLFYFYYFIIILQVTFGVKWLHLIVQYSLDSSVSFSRFKDFVWLLNLCLVNLFWQFLCKFFVYSWAGSMWSVLRKCLGLSIFHLEGSCSYFCNCSFPRSQGYCLKLSYCGCL